MRVYFLLGHCWGANPPRILDSIPCKHRLTSLLTLCSSAIFISSFLLALRPLQTDFMYSSMAQYVHRLEWESLDSSWELGISAILFLIRIKDQWLEHHQWEMMTKNYFWTWWWRNGPCCWSYPAARTPNVGSPQKSFTWGLGPNLSVLSEFSLAARN